MTRQFLRLTVSACIGVISFAAVAVAQVPEPAEADREWVNRNLMAAREQLLPVRTASNVAAFLSSRDAWTDRPEPYFAINSVPSYPTGSPMVEVFKATVVVPTGGSIRTQLTRLHMADAWPNGLGTLMRRSGSAPDSSGLSATPDPRLNSVRLRRA